MADYIAERTIFGVVNGDEIQVVVRVQTPERADDGVWLCRFSFQSKSQMHGLEDGAAHGEDSMQAVEQALYGVGWTLDRSGNEWSMFPAKELQAEETYLIGEDGFPRAGLSVMFGSVFRKRMERYVESEKIEFMKSHPRKRRPTLPPI